MKGICLLGVLMLAITSCKSQEDTASSASKPSSSFTVQTLDGGREDISDLIEAVDYGRLDAVHHFLENGADVNARDFRGDTALHKTANIFGDQVAIARVLIEHGADVNAVNKEGRTPLHDVCTLGNTELVHAFVENGADLNRIDNEGHSPLDFAIHAANGRDPQAEPGYGLTIQYLTFSGAHPNKPIE
jgi:ankyrin repeat protein